MQPLWRTVHIKLKIELSYEPAIPLLGMCLEKTIPRKETCTPVFTVAIFTTANIWKQPKCPSAGEWIKKMWYIGKYNGILAIKTKYCHLQ